MKLKPNVRFGSHHPAMFMAAMVINSILQSHGHEFVITSYNDGIHGDDSLHPHDKAFDFRSKHILVTEDKQKILSEIKASLTIEFDVLLEYLDTDNEHFHLELDRE